MITTDLTDDPVAEESTAILSFQVQDEDGNNLGADVLDSLTFTLYNKTDEAIINSRTGVDILNAGPGTVDSDGIGEVVLDADDNIIVGTLRAEDHMALFAWTWAGGSREGKHQVRIRVQNLGKVPSA